jgi:two-component system chemotaxis response regulator CheB
MKKSKSKQLGARSQISSSCPECNGHLTEITQGALSQYRCEIGHVFSPGSLSEAHSEALERALWIAVRTLNERAAIHQTLARQSHHDPAMGKRYKESALAASRDVDLLQDILERI